MVPAFFFCFKALNQCCTGLKLSLWGVPLAFSLSFLTAPTANLRTAAFRIIYYIRYLDKIRRPFYTLLRYLI